MLNIYNSKKKLYYRIPWECYSLKIFLNFLNKKYTYTYIFLINPFVFHRCLGDAGDTWTWQEAWPAAGARQEERKRWKPEVPAEMWQLLLANILLLTFSGKILNIFGWCEKIITYICIYLIYILAGLDLWLS